MIKLARRSGNAVPKSLSGNGLLKKNLELIGQVMRSEIKFKSQYWKAGKNQLKADTFGKCAYCEAPTTVVAHGDVEHFRPKAIYWWLAYCYENHLFACQICNQTYKSDNFPLTGKRMSPPRIGKGIGKDKLRLIALRLNPDPSNDKTGMPLKTFRILTRAEKALLLDPYMFDPEDFFGWEADEDLKEVRVIASKNTIQARRIVWNAEKYLGLNREELRRVRYRTFEKLAVFKRVLESSISDELREDVTMQICKMTERQAEFAAMTRFFVKRWKLKLSCDETQDERQQNVAAR